MSQLGEAVAVDTASAKHNEKTCPFCSEDESKSIDNDLVNDASKLRTSCHEADRTGKPEPCTGESGSDGWCVVYTHPETGNDELSELRTNPHHLIPGNASLKGQKYQSPLLECIEKSKGTITGDIGYDVNKKENGIWLPTILENFYAGYSGVDPIAGIKWGALTKRYPKEQFSMAEAAMFEAKRQFHDTHEDYSEHVKERLQKLMDKTISRKRSCPEAGPKEKPDVPPPFGLVDWMDSLSHRLAGFLKGPPERWRHPIWTSRHAKEFVAKLKSAD